MTSSPNSDLLSLARDIALEAGALAAKRKSEGIEVAASKSSIEDIVTAADREVEQLIRGRLADARPADGFYGEESGAEVGSSGLTWVVDPIDGTVNYLYGIPQYAVSIAIVEGEPDPQTWRALAGTVFNPATDELFTATEGGGAFLAGNRLQIPERPDLSQALIATGFAYDASRRVHQGRVIAELLGRVRDIRRFGSASLDLVGVAAGRVNAYVERELSPWDHAAGALIATEAGAAVTGIELPRADRAGIVAAHPDLAAELREILLELGY